MIIPSIDLMDGQAVQLVGGRDKLIDAGDPLPIAERFSLAGELAVVDLDAALGRGSNEALCRELCRRHRVRLGGGIRDVATARRWLDLGARKVVLGTAAHPEVLRALPRERVVVALDAMFGEVVVDGWRTKTGMSVEARMAELRGLCGGFLVTFVEREGRLMGIDLARVEALVAHAGDCRLTVAGGVTTADDIAALDRLGVDAQVGMALYNGRLDLGDAISAPLAGHPPDGLFATVLVDRHDRALGVRWSSRQSVRDAVATRKGVYLARSRGPARDDEARGAADRLVRIDLDRDRETLRFVVDQGPPGSRHEATASCWGDQTGLAHLAQRLRARAQSAPPGSYTRRLLDDPELLRSKLQEEAAELADAEGADAVKWETADVLYFAMVAMVRAGVPLDDVEAELDRRAAGVTRRDGSDA